MPDETLKHVVLLSSLEIFKGLTVAEIDNKFPDFYGTRMFITVFTTSRRWMLFSFKNRVENLLNVVINLKGVLYSPPVNTGFLKGMESALPLHYCEKHVNGGTRLFTFVLEINSIYAVCDVKLQ
jgi:hypothetical protein